MTESEKLDLILAKLDKIDKLESMFVEFNERLDRLESEFREFKERLDRLESEFRGFKEKLEGLENEIGELKEKQDQLECDVTAVKLTLENEIRSSIMRVAEGHQDLYRRLREATKTDDEKEMIAIRVSILETELRTIKEQLGQIA